MSGKRFLFICIFYIFISLSCSSDLYSDKVINYDSKSFEENIGKGVPHFVNFFAPWCGFCKRLKPVWDELAEKYNSGLTKPRVIIAKVDCTIETPVCAKEGVSGYPWLMFYNPYEVAGAKYQGKRDLVGLEEFILNNLKDGESDNVEYPMPESFHSEENVVVLTNENILTKTVHGMHFVKFYAPWCGHCQRMARSWAELADILVHDKAVTISEVDCTVNQKTCYDFEVKAYPTLLWIANGKMVEKYEGEKDLNSFKTFVTKMKLNHAESLTSNKIDDEEILEDDVNLVVELSDENFESIVANGYSYVKFFVPWCGHCKKLAPVWNKLAKKFVKNSQVKVAEVDCTKHDKLCSKHKVIGYPTLLIFHNGKFIAEFHGDRNLEQLHSFMLEYLHHSEL